MNVNRIFYLIAVDLTLSILNYWALKKVSLLVSRVNSHMVLSVIVTFTESITQIK